MPCVYPPGVYIKFYYTTYRVHDCGQPGAIPPPFKDHLFYTITKIVESSKSVEVVNVVCQVQASTRTMHGRYQGVVLTILLSCKCMGLDNSFLLLGVS